MDLLFDLNYPVASVRLVQLYICISASIDELIGENIKSDSNRISSLLNFVCFLHAAYNEMTVANNINNDLTETCRLPNYISR